MVRLFHRHYAPAFWNRDALEGPCKGLTLREWEVGVILCSLPPAIRQALLAWLVAPTDGRWPAPSAAGACGCRAPALSASPRAPAPESFSRQRAAFAPGELRQPVRPLPTLLFDEVKAIRQTLDMSLDALDGITREMLLVAHGTRLRQVSAALGERCALGEIEALLRLTRREQPRVPAFLRTRWGGRWGAYFAGAGG
ncbi:MAG TPA: hypothetical protein VH590_12270 [Ktedonobacterales bacterium]|jgi:hypothetical protein